jgi:ABC-type sugar transport system permease subunit
MRSDTGIAWLLTMPAILTYLAMILLPLLAVLAMAFTDYELGARGFRWIGFANFADMANDRTFAASIRNTVVYCLFVAPLSIGIALGLAVLIEAGARGRAFWRAVFFLPVVSLTVAMATAWQYLLHPSIGPLNALLRLVGASTPNWLGSSDWVIVSLGFIGVWENVGFNLVLFLAGLTAIPRELYAASEVDGARSNWSKFWLVTWPARLSPTSNRAVSGVLSSWATSLTQRSCCCSWASRERRLCSCTPSQPTRPGTTITSRSWLPVCHSSRWGLSWRRAILMLPTRAGSSQISTKGCPTSSLPASSWSSSSALGLMWPMLPA